MSSSPCAAGTRNTSTPAWATADAFWRRPPIAPTVPSSSIVPVIAMFWPPVSSPGVSSSIRVSVNASPADGPPMRPVSMSSSNGNSTRCVSNGRKPTIVRSGSSGADVSSTVTVSSPTSGRSSLISTVSPGSLSASAAERSSTLLNGAPSTSSNRSPGSSTSSDGLDSRHSVPVVVGDEAHHLADQHVARHDRHVVADGLQRHVLRDLLRGPHRLEPERAALLRGLEAELLLLGEELDGRLVAADEPRQNRLRRAR